MTALNAAGYVLDAGDGEHIWFSGTLMSVKAGSEQTRDGFTLIEVLTPPGYVVPWHIHVSKNSSPRLANLPRSPLFHRRAHPISPDC